MIRASKLLGADVVEIKNKKIGVAVNVIFKIDPDAPLASLLVIPDNRKSLMDICKETIRDNVEDWVKQYFPEDIPKLKDLAAKASKEGAKVWQNYLKQKEKELMETYYVIPLSETQNPGQGKIKKIKINHDYVDCDQFRCEPDKNTDFPFFRRRSFTGIDSPRTTLNLEHVEGLKHSLPDGKKGLTVDLELDYDGGLVENLIVQTYGKGAGKYRVSTKDFDFSELKAKQMTPIPNDSGDT